MKDVDRFRVVFRARGGGLVRVEVEAKGFRPARDGARARVCRTRGILPGALRWQGTERLTHDVALRCDTEKSRA